MIGSLKYKVIPVHTMKACMGKQRYTSAQSWPWPWPLYPWKRTLVSI